MRIPIMDCRLFTQRRRCFNNLVYDFVSYTRTTDRRTPNLHAITNTLTATRRTHTHTKKHASKMSLNQTHVQTHVLRAHACNRTNTEKTGDTYTETCTRTCISVCVHIHIHIYIHINIYIYISIYYIYLLYIHPCPQVHACKLHTQNHVCST